VAEPVAPRARLLSPQFLLVTAAGILYFLALGSGMPIVLRYVKGPLGGDDLAVGIAVGAFAVGAILLRPYSGRLGDRINRRFLVIVGALVVAGFVAFVPLYVGDVGWENSRNAFLLCGVLILVIRIAGAKLLDRLGPLQAGTLALGFGAGGLLVMAAWASVAGLLLGTVLFAIGMAFMYPSLMMLALVGVDDTQRAAVVGTFSTFFDLSQGLGALIVGTIAQLSGYRGAFAGSALIALGGLLLRSGLDPRVRARHVEVHAREEIPEPEPGT